MGQFCDKYVCVYRSKKYIYIRYENLKHIVLDELLSKHDHAELNAQLDEAAWWSALWRKKTHIYSRHRCTFT